MKNSAESVMRHYIQPLSRIYNRKPTDGMIAAMCEDLLDFSDNELIAGVKLTRRSSKYFPTIAEAYKACNDAKRGDSQREGVSYASPSDSKRIAREDMVSSGANDFKKSQLYVKAVSEGWDWHLECYVRELILLRAHHSHGEQSGIPYNSIVLFGAGHTMTKTEIERFIDQQKYASDIEIPMPMIDKWNRLIANLTKKE